MEISRHGCNPTSQLGNALVVSLFIWVGLSGLYRLLALVVAPSIELKHCLCVTGYGFFAWNVALLCIYPLENFSEWLNIPTMLPLVIFGIPSSLAQVMQVPSVRDVCVVCLCPWIVILQRSGFAIHITRVHLSGDDMLTVPLVSASPLTLFTRCIFACACRALCSGSTPRPRR
jgi:hypothetical protein